MYRSMLLSCQYKDKLGALTIDEVEIGVEYGPTGMLESATATVDLDGLVGGTEFTRWAEGEGALREDLGGGITSSFCSNW